MVVERIPSYPVKIRVRFAVGWLCRATGKEGGESSGEQEPPSDENQDSGEIVMETVRRGSQHAVSVGLEGTGGVRVDQSLLVDTGADQVVLPASLAGKLGLNADELSERDLQTANGKVKARFGKVSALWLSQTRVSDVDVAFVEDAKLGNNGLLGMSVLGGYIMTIDDEKSRLTLNRK